MALRARASRVPAVGALLVSIGVAFFAGWINLVSACFGARRRAAVTGAVGWALVTAALLGLVWHASSNTGAGLVLWELLGAALLAAALVRISAER